MKRWAKVQVGFDQAVLEQVARDREDGEWTGPDPDPTLSQVARVLIALGRMGYVVSKAQPAVEPMVTHEPPAPPPPQHFVVDNGKLVPTLGGGLGAIGGSFTQAPGLVALAAAIEAGFWGDGFTPVGR